SSISPRPTAIHDAPPASLHVQPSDRFCWSGQVMVMSSGWSAVPSAEVARSTTWFTPAFLELGVQRTAPVSGSTFIPSGNAPPPTGTSVNRIGPLPETSGRPRSEYWYAMPHDPAAAGAER